MMMIEAASKGTWVLGTLFSVRSKGSEEPQVGLPRWRAWVGGFSGWDLRHIYKLHWVVICQLIGLQHGLTQTLPLQWDLGLHLPSLLGPAPMSGGTGVQVGESVRDAPSTSLSFQLVLRRKKKSTNKTNTVIEWMKDQVVDHLIHLTRTQEMEY